MSGREIPEVVTCPICQQADWVDLGDGETVRIMSMDVHDWLPIDTNVFTCKRCGFVRLHMSEEPIKPPEENH